MTDTPLGSTGSESEPVAPDPSSSATSAELLFILLPLIVVCLVHIYKGRVWTEIIGSPEWAFAASLMFGQSLVKFVSGVSHRGILNWEEVAFTASMIIVLGLVPSLVVLVLILTSDKSTTFLKVLQIGLFAIGFATFMQFGKIGHKLMSKEK